MTDKKKRQRARRREMGPVNMPSYCPHCQRLYRTHPIDFTCPHDATTLIFMDDPLPARSFEGGMSALTVVAVTAVGLVMSMF